MQHSSLPARNDNSGHLFNKLGPIEYRVLTGLQPYAGNPRKHDQRQLTALCADIREFGFNVPLLIKADGEIVCGHARYGAARELGLDKVPCIVLDHLTDGQVRAFRVADNRLAELGKWDDAALRIEVAAIIELGEVEIDLLGFETAEIDVILGEDERLADPVAGDAANQLPPDGTAVSRTGDLWRMGSHRLLCGSTRDADVWSRLLDRRQAAMVFTDPPWNVPINGHVSGTGRHAEFAEASGEMTDGQFVAFLSETIGNMAHHVREGGIIEVCIDHRGLPALYDAIKTCRLERLNLCVWDKGVGGMGSLWRSQHELIVVAKKGTAPHTNNVQLGRYGRNRTNCWRYPSANQSAEGRRALASHPTPKPVALVADAIRDVTHQSEIVLDGFMGSGTTLLAAERTGRVAYGVEIEGQYVDTAIRRWEQMTGKQAVLDETQETFTAVADRRSAETVDPPADGPASSPRIRTRGRPLAA